MSERSPWSFSTVGSPSADGTVGVKPALAGDSGIGGVRARSRGVSMRVRVLGIPLKGCIFAGPTLGAPDSDVGPHGVRAAILDWSPEADHSTVAVTAAVKLRYREKLGGRRRIHSLRGDSYGA